MALGSKQRDYISSHIRTRATLELHAQLTKGYGLKGIENPSKVAYDEILAGKHDRELKKKIIEIRARRRGKMS